MRHLTFIFIFLAFCPLYAISQGYNHFIKSKLLQADSVIIVSHQITAGVKIINDSTAEEIPLPELIIHGKPNETIIKERQVINGKYLDTLINILDRPFLDKTITTSKCFMPHHAIFIHKNGKTSFFEICFSCNGFETSTDLNSVYAFDTRKWTELFNFFKNRGLKYELE
jgi:hypothetical protein